MGAVLGFAILLFCLWLLNRSIRDARGGAWTGPRTSGMRSRAAAGRAGAQQRPVRHEMKLMRLKAQLDDWREQQRHARQNGTGGTATAAPPRQTLRQRLRLRPFTAQPSGPGGGGTANGTRPPASPSPPPGPASASSTGGQVAATGSQPSYKGGDFGKVPNGGHGGTVAGTSTASAEKLIEGINEIHAHAQAGGIHAKQEAVKAAHEASVRFAAMVQMLARQMSEPGQNYGHEITEPIAKSGQHHQAAAMALSEADANLSTLINMTLGDLARSARQAPHHAELSESGSR